MAAAAALTVTSLAGAVLVPGAAASPATPGAGWELTAHTAPTNLAPGGTGFIVISVYNIGAASSIGTVTVTDVLPPGMTATDAGLMHEESIRHELWKCEGTTVVTCTNVPPMETLAGGGGGPRDQGPLFAPQIGIAVTVDPKTPERKLPNCLKEPKFCNHVTVASGGAQTSASTTEPITVSSTPAGFGIAGWDVWLSNADGTIDTQAGSHPYLATFSLDLNTNLNEFGGWHMAGGAVRVIEVNLPPGFVGDPSAVPQCPRELFDGGENGLSHCPPDSQVGIVTSVISNGTSFDREAVYDLVPRPGAPATFGFTVVGINGLLDAAVRSGSDYGITTHIDNVPERAIEGGVVTLWGVPADPSHDAWRAGFGGCAANCPASGAPLKPFLTLPTSCAGQPEFSVRANTWQHPNVAVQASVPSHDANGDPTSYRGCEHLAFGPSISAKPDTAKADTPAGFTFELQPPLGGLSEPNGLSTADIQGTTVTLPEGLVINPGQAAGLQACQESESGIGTAEAPRCPLASKVGTVTAKTPLLEGSAEKELQGNVYVMQSNPPNLKLLVAPSADGINVKQVLNVHLGEATGQLVTTTANFPQAPVTDVKLSFSGGAQAALATPTACGSYTTTSDFTPWSSPFVADAFPTASFATTKGPGGSACPSSPLPFAPSLAAGSTTDQAGAFTNFSLLLQRGDGQQRIERLQFKEPAGLAGLISNVPLCPEPLAAEGKCSEASRIGHAAVASGPGPYPLTIPQPGQPESGIYLTGPYQGAPFGLSIVTHVIAGPFDLEAGTPCDCIVTRAKIEIDPRTGQITVTTDPLPQIVAGVPTDLRLVNSVIDRPNFLFNPTNCAPQEFTGTAWGTPPPGVGGPGATAAISSHFGVGFCHELAFTPKVSVTTAAKSSKANGASLLFKVGYPKGALGSQSWFNEAKFDLPKQLPARLSTIQKACLAGVFEANPAGCPPASLIGHAIVHTQVLPVPLTGPVYFVSHGGAKFPDAVIVLQGDGVTVDLVGETFIKGKTGITSATFRNTPDVPFESIEVTVPSGPFSEFGANLPAKAHGSFCGQKLVMPTFFKAQNGLEIHQNTKVGVTGCPKARKAHKAYRARHKGKHASRSR
jgi:uncharacterized repeat protein (TIGR01451 family)